MGTGNVPAGLFAIPRLDIAWTGQTRSDAPPGVVRQQWLDSEGRLVATGGNLGDSRWMHWRGLATFWFGDTGVVRAEPVHPGLDEELRDIFVRGVIPIVLLARGFEGLHASAVLEPAGVVALCATSGTGKSTIALALAAAGARQYADDTVLYSLVGGQPTAISLPFPVRVDDSARLAVGASPQSAPTSAAASPSAPFHRIYHLVRDNDLDPVAPSFLPVPSARRFELLLAHAHPFDLDGDDRRRAFMERLMTLARRVDVWECRFAPDLAALPSLAASIRAHAAGV